MITRPASRLVQVALRTRAPIAAPITRSFSTTRENQAKNRVYTPVRRADDFHSYLQLSTSSRTALLTLWTASYCSTCKTVSPVIQELVEAGVGEEEGGVAFCEVEYDTPDVMDSGLGMTYMITSLPTLLSFDRGEAQSRTRVVDPKKMTDREWLKEWIRSEAGKRGSGERKSNLYGGRDPDSLFGGLFGNTKR